MGGAGPAVGRALCPGIPGQSPRTPGLGAGGDPGVLRRRGFAAGPGGQGLADSGGGGSAGLHGMGELDLIAEVGRRIGRAEVRPHEFWARAPPSSRSLPTPTLTATRVLPTERRTFSGFSSV